MTDYDEPTGYRCRKHGRLEGPHCDACEPEPESDWLPGGMVRIHFTTASGKEVEFIRNRKRLRKRKRQSTIVK